jgi:hypothetical protein
MGYNNLLVLVKAPLAEVSRALARQHSGSTLKSDVLNCEVRLATRGLFVLRLRDHAWTEVLGTSDDLLMSPALSALSRDTGSQVIEFTVSSTCGAIGYTYWVAGDLVESFQYIGGEVTFDSTRRRLTPADIKDGWRFADEFLQEQEVSDPGIYARYFLGNSEYRTGTTVVLQNPGIACNVSGKTVTTRLPIERLDYLALPE